MLLPAFRCGPLHRLSGAAAQADERALPLLPLLPLLAGYW